MRGPQRGWHLSDGGGDVCPRAGVQVFDLPHEVEIILDSIRKKKKGPCVPNPASLRNKKKCFGLAWISVMNCEPSGQVTCEVRAIITDGDSWRLLFTLLALKQGYERGAHLHSKVFLNLDEGEDFSVPAKLHGDAGGNLSKCFPTSVELMERRQWY